MKKSVNNKNTSFILIALLLSAVSIRLLTIDSNSKVYISTDKTYSDEMLSQKMNSVDGVTAKNEESFLPSGTPAQTQTNKIKQVVYAQNDKKTNLTNASFQNQPSPEVLPVLTSDKNDNLSKQGMTEEIKINESLPTKSIENYQDITNVSKSNNSSNYGVQKAKPNGPGMEGSLPIGDGFWLLILFAIVYGVNKYFFAK